MVCHLSDALRVSMGGETGEADQQLVYTVHHEVGWAIEHPNAVAAPGVSTVPEYHAGIGGTNTAEFESDLTRGAEGTIRAVCEPAAQL